MKKRYQEGGPIDEMEEANNRPQIVSRRRPLPPMLSPMPSPNDESGRLQNMISSGSDIVGRPQDEGYRPNAGTAMERATAEGAYDSGKITENTGPRTKPIVKSMPKAMPAMPKPAARDTGSDMARMMNRGKSAEMPAGSPGRGKSVEVVDDTTKSVTDRAKATRESARSGSGTTDSRDVNQRLRDSGIGSSISNYFKNFKTPAERKAQEQKEKASKGSYSSGGKVSASNRGDGIAQRGKTRGKMC